MCKCIKYAYNMFMNKINLLLTQANDNLKDCRATIEKATENLISEMIAHELCHAARWGKK